MKTLEQFLYDHPACDETHYKVYVEGHKDGAQWLLKRQADVRSSRDARIRINGNPIDQAWLRVEEAMRSTNELLKSLPPIRTNTRAR